MVSLVTCKNEEDPIKNEGPRVLTRFSTRRSRAANSAVRGRIWPNFELIRYLIVVLITCNNEENAL